MKVINILWMSLLVCLTSCEEKSKEYTYENETTERITCPICNGYGCNLCAQSGNGTVWIPVEEHITEIRKGSNERPKRFMGIVTPDVDVRFMFPKAVVMKTVQVVLITDVRQINLDININF